MRSASSSGELLLALEPVAQTLALDEGHREPEPGPAGLSGAGFARVEHRQDVGMLEASGQPDLALEALGPSACDGRGAAP